MDHNIIHHIIACHINFLLYYIIYPSMYHTMYHISVWRFLTQLTLSTIWFRISSHCIIFEKRYLFCIFQCILAQGHWGGKCGTCACIRQEDWGGKLGSIWHSHNTTTWVENWHTVDMLFVNLMRLTRKNICIFLHEYIFPLRYDNITSTKPLSEPMVTFYQLVPLGTNFRDIWTKMVIVSFHGIILKMPFTK